MHLEYSDEFKQSVKIIKDKIALNRLDNLIAKLEAAHNLREVSNVESISNNPFTYRVRTGNYRLIVKYIDGAITILLIEYAKRNEKTYKKYR